MRFADRLQAGQLLADSVASHDPADPVVFALPRGGVPVGFQVAEALDCPLDVLVVRKLGVPFQPELAMGAMGEGGLVVRNEEVLRLAGVSEEQLESVIEQEARELERRVAAYRGSGERLTAAGKTAIVVDDGLATGSTALAAVSVLASQQAREVWLAAPVAPHEPLVELEARTDRMIILSRPRHFGAVGAWYADFGQTSDAEVRELLRRSRLR